MGVPEPVASKCVDDGNGGSIDRTQSLTISYRTCLQACKRLRIAHD